VKKPIINCHTHIFTGDHVPPWLAKTFLPWPFYFLLPLSMIVKFFRVYYRGSYRDQFQGDTKQRKKIFYSIKVFILRNIIIRFIAFVTGWWLTLHVFFILFGWLASLIAPDSKTAAIVNDAHLWLEDRNLLFIPESLSLKLVMVIIVILFVKSGRNFILFIFKKIWSFFKILPGPQTKELIRRYITIGRFSFHGRQEKNYEQLRNQYPEDTGFVILPMDMEFMGAGHLKKEFRYRKQMEVLAAIKEKPAYHDHFFPFVFADPRRMITEDDYFKYKIEGDKIILEDCFIKEYIEEKKFSGFKIYPALGYYPFDETLLPLWKYAADNGIPVLTHCIRGNIFYRGAKKKAWDYHPLFEQAAGDERYEPLLLPQMKNIEWINNFTHPMNYLCLLEEKLLRKLVGRTNDEQIKKMFGYKDDRTALLHDLHHLKICFGHYGGEDEWKKFLESDRDNYSSQLAKQPNWGIDFLANESGEEKRGKPEQIWKNVDWYSIISSIMLQYPHVYSDLSFILHDPAIQPLLRQTMQNEKLKKKVLYGTDFYVVRNHKSDKQMLAEMMDELSEEEFDLIARDNPRIFLKNVLHGEVKI
jgi:Amidohydrolase